MTEITWEKSTQRFLCLILQALYLSLQFPNSGVFLLPQFFQLLVPSLAALLGICICKWLVLVEGILESQHSPRIAPLIFSRVCRRASGIVEGRRLHVTHKGHIGLTAIAARNGDVVCLLLGCSIPVTLRPYKNRNYRLVGESCIHGLMEGEAMPWLGSDHQFSVEDFIIT